MEHALPGTAEINGPAEKEWAVLARSVGGEVRKLRQLAGLSGRALAQKSGLSVGMLSKIENGTSAPSFATLMVLSDHLGVPVARFFAGFGQHSDCSVVRAGQGVIVERQGAQVGQTYELLGHVLSGEFLVEPYLVTLDSQLLKAPSFQHNGLEFVYILQGAMSYRYGDQLIELDEGDSLLFDATTIHGPESVKSGPLRYISAVFSNKE